MKNLKYTLSIIACFFLLNHSFAQTFNLDVEKGYGSGIYSAGDTIHVFSRALMTYEIFSHWTSSDSEIEIVHNEDEWRMVLIMPEKDLTLTANFITLESDFIQYEEIASIETMRPVYIAKHDEAIASVFVFHGTGGKASNWIGQKEEQRFALVKEIYHAGFNVIITESEESTSGIDLDVDGKIKFHALPIDTFNGIDYLNMQTIMDTLSLRGWLKRDKIMALGMSSGGAFSGTFGFIFDAMASVIYCAASQPAVIQFTDTPMLFCIMPNDETIGPEGNQRALENSNILADRNICSRFYENDIHPIYPEFFERIGLDFTQSNGVYNDLDVNGYLDENAFIVGLINDIENDVMDNPQNWPNIVQLSGQEQNAVGGLIRLAYGGHRLYANHNKKTIDFLKRQCETTSVENPDLSIRNLLVYPNPTQNKIYLNNSFKGSIFNIRNQVGQLIKNGKVESDYINLDINPGLYFLTIEDGTQIKKTSFVVY